MSTDERLKKAAGEGKVDRAMQDRAVTQDRKVVEQDRLREFLGSFQQTHLPDLPPIPGYHVCWLTTTSQADPLHKRLRAGYELIKAAEVPGYEAMSMKTGEYAGCIGVNEMVAAKLPEDDFQRLMRIVHHDEPLREESKIKAQVESLREKFGSNVQPAAQGEEDGWR